MSEPEQPKVYKPHPKQSGYYQCFHPTITLVEDPKAKTAKKKFKKVIDFGDSQGDYRPAEEGEEPDVTLFSDADRAQKGYVRIDYVRIRPGDK